MSSVDGKAKDIEGHVHFTEDCSPRSTIIVQTVANNELHARCGFLQVNHEYELKVPLPLPAPANLYQPIQQPSLALRSINIQESDGAVLAVVSLLAYKQKLLQERVQLAADSGTITLTISARVLGPGQGTPMLLEGVRQTGVQPIDDSEVSDWQGFD